MPKSVDRPAVKSADRVLDIFELFARWGQEMSHAEIAEHLGIPKSSLSQLLNTLEVRGYLELVANKKNYRLGQALIKLSSQRASVRDLLSVAKPMLNELSRACAESSAVNVLQGDESVVVSTVLGPHRLVTHMREGDRAPLYATSGGKVLLAFLPAGMRDEYFSRVQFTSMLPNTISSVSELRKQIDKIRREGVAYSIEEFTSGIIGIAVPIGAGAGIPLASLNIAMPATRDNPETRDRIISALRRSAQLTERRLQDPLAVAWHSPKSVDK